MAVLRSLKQKRQIQQSFLSPYFGGRTYISLYAHGTDCRPLMPLAKFALEASSVRECNRIIYRHSCTSIWTLIILTPEFARRRAQAGLLYSMNLKQIRYDRCLISDEIEQVLGDGSFASKIRSRIDESPSAENKQLFQHSFDITYTQLSPASCWQSKRFRE